MELDQKPIRTEDVKDSYTKLVNHLAEPEGSAFLHLETLIQKTDLNIDTFLVDFLHKDYLIQDNNFLVEMAYSFFCNNEKQLYKYQIEYRCIVQQKHR